MKPKYTAMPNGVLSAAQAEIAARELSRIRKKHGCIKPAYLVKASEPESAPLHDCFTWDNGEAAEQWRIEEARRIIRSVRVVVKPGPLADQSVIRAFVHVEASEKESRFDGDGYIETLQAHKSPIYRDQVLAAAKRELIEWKRRYEDYREFFGGVFAAIEDEVEAG